MSDTVPQLVIVSGPSGAGKSTVVKELLKVAPVPLKLSVSATTRARRDGEQDGRDYHFLSHEEFRERRERGEFLECKEVFGRGDWYGTLRSEVVAAQADGQWVLLEIDVEGAARSVLDELPDAITIFIHPGSEEELERRLRERGTDTPAAIAHGLEVAQQEMALAGSYRYRVVNDTVPQAVARICEILADHNRIGDSGE